MLLKKSAEYGSISRKEIDEYVSHVGDDIFQKGFLKVNLTADNPFTPHLKRALEERGIEVLVNGKEYIPDYLQKEMGYIAECMRHIRKGEDIEAEDTIRRLIDVKRNERRDIVEGLMSAYKIINRMLTKYGIEMPLVLQIEESHRKLIHATLKHDVAAYNEAYVANRKLERKYNQILRERADASKSANRSGEER